MRLRRLHVVNLGSYVEETVDFDQLPSPLVVTGVNGAGKSTLFVDAITLALFNRARALTSTGSGIEQLIRQGSDRVTVELEFELNGHLYKVVRRRGPNSHELEFWVDGVDHSEKITETQQKINQLLKLDYDTFIDTVCIGQGRSSSFMDKKPDQRKEVFGEVLGLSRYDVLAEAARERRKQVREELDTAKRRLEALSQVPMSLTQLNQELVGLRVQETELLTQLTQREAELRAELKRRAEYEAKLANYEQALRRKAELTPKLAQLRASVTKGLQLERELTTQLVDLQDLTSQQERLSQELESLREQLTEVQQRQTALEVTLQHTTSLAKELKARYERLRDHEADECEFCGQVIHATTKADNLARFKAEAQAQLNLVKTQREELNQLKAQVQTLSQQVQETKLKLVQVERQLREQTELRTRLENVQTKLAGLQTQLASLEEEHEYLESLTQLDLREEFRDEELQATLTRLRQRHDELRQTLVVKETQRDQLEAQQRELTELEARVQHLTQEYADWDDLVHAFGKSGIQALIIENNLLDVQAEVNEVLGLLSNDKVELEFRTQKLKKSKSETVETLDIIVRDELGERVYETYSGGERFRIDFACHVGLAQFLARRAGASIRFFILDEGVGSQDQAAKTSLQRCLQSLSGKFDHVLVISHIEDFIEDFDHRLLVTKDSELGSKVQLLS